MKKYLKPSIEITKFEVEDVIMISIVDTTDPDGGWGDMQS